MKLTSLLITSALVASLFSCQQEQVKPTTTTPTTTQAKTAVKSKLRPITVTASLTDDYLVSFRVTQTTGISHTRFRWVFGDGTTVTTNDPHVIHQYPCTRKTYTVQVYEDHPIGATFGNGAVTVLVKNDGSGIIPLNIASTRGSNIRIRNFTARGGEGCHGNKFYHWTFGDGSTALTTTSTVSHQYSYFGNYTVTVTIKDGANRVMSGPASITERVFPIF
ncbi:MAG TPA: hypothetical protein DCS93_13430 [Microscillaceae bacterium]|nr:hypothetical protein [Microscillaceae bacterium]